MMLSVAVLAAFAAVAVHPVVAHAHERHLPVMAQSASFTVQAHYLEMQMTVTRNEMYSHKQKKFRVDAIENEAMGTTKWQDMMKIKNKGYEEGIEVDYRTIVDFDNVSGVRS